MLLLNCTGNCASKIKVIGYARSTVFCTIASLKAEKGLNGKLIDQEVIKKCTYHFLVGLKKVNQDQSLKLMASLLCRNLS